MKIKKNPLILFVLLLATGLAGCGGSSSGGKQSSETQIIKLEGTAVKGVIKNAAVSLFAIIDGSMQEQAIATTITDENGHYSIDLQSDYKGPALVRVTGLAEDDAGFPSTMTCDVTPDCGDGINFGDDFIIFSDFLLSAVVPNVSADERIVVNITALTDLAASYALSESRKTAAEFESANQQVADLFGLDQSVISLSTVDITDPELLQEAGDTALKNALFSAGLQAALMEGDAKTLAENFQLQREDFANNGGQFYEVADSSSGVSLHAIVSHSAQTAVMLNAGESLVGEIQDFADGIDSDGDGVSDKNDFYPHDSKKQLSPFTGSYAVDADGMLGSFGISTDFDVDEAGNIVWEVMGSSVTGKIKPDGSFEASGSIGSASGNFNEDGTFTASYSSSIGGDGNFWGSLASLFAGEYKLQASDNNFISLAFRVSKVGGLVWDIGYVDAGIPVHVSVETEVQNDGSFTAVVNDSLSLDGSISEEGLLSASVFSHLGEIIFSDEQSLPVFHHDPSFYSPFEGNYVVEADGLSRVISRFTVSEWGGLSWIIVTEKDGELRQESFSAAVDSDGNFSGVGMLYSGSQTSPYSIWGQLNQNGSVSGYLTSLLGDLSFSGSHISLYKGTYDVGGGGVLEGGASFIVDELGQLTWTFDYSNEGEAFPVSITAAVNVDGSFSAVDALLGSVEGVINQDGTVAGSFSLPDTEIFSGTKNISPYAGDYAVESDGIIDSYGGSITVEDDGHFILSVMGFLIEGEVQADGGFIAVGSMASSIVNGVISPDGTIEASYTSSMGNGSLLAKPLSPFAGDYAIKTDKNGLVTFSFHVTGFGEFVWRFAYVEEGIPVQATIEGLVLEDGSFSGADDENSAEGSINEEGLLAGSYSTASFSGDFISDNTESYSGDFEVYLDYFGEGSILTVDLDGHLVWTWKYEQDGLAISEVFETDLKENGSFSVEGDAFSMEGEVSSYGRINAIISSPSLGEFYIYGSRVSPYANYYLLSADGLNGLASTFVVDKFGWVTWTAFDSDGNVYFAYVRVSNDGSFASEFVSEYYPDSAIIWGQVTEEGLVNGYYIADPLAGSFHAEAVNNE